MFNTVAVLDEIELKKKSDTSTTEDIQPCGLMLSIFVIF